MGTYQIRKRVVISFQPFEYDPRSNSYVSPRNNKSGNFNNYVQNDRKTIAENTSTSIKESCHTKLNGLELSGLQEYEYEDTIKLVLVKPRAKYNKRKMEEEKIENCLEKKAKKYSSSTTINDVIDTVLDDMNIKNKLPLQGNNIEEKIYHNSVVEDPGREDNLPHSSDKEEGIATSDKVEMLDDITIPIGESSSTLQELQPIKTLGEVDPPRKAFHKFRMKKAASLDDSLNRNGVMIRETMIPQKLVKYKQKTIEDMYFDGVTLRRNFIERKSLEEPIRKQQIMDDWLIRI